MARPTSGKLGPIFGLAILMAAASGCRGPAYYEKKAFVNPVMRTEPDRGETHLRQKVHYSREAAIGGIGETAGGGCGCY
jgi:hypothetical protein